MAGQVRVVVGRGIIGLSVAEVLSRTLPVIVLFRDEPWMGSKAAAANLSTKAQVFARDPHFDLKLKGKSKYRSWFFVV